MSYKNPITSNAPKVNKVRLKDFSGGINLRVSADLIDDNEFQEIYNMSPEGNKLILIKGYSLLRTLTGSGRINGLKLFSKYLIALNEGNLHIINLDTGAVTTRATSYSNNSDRYQILVNKVTELSIILINTSTATTEDIKAYEFDETALTFTAKSFTGLTDANFKCGAFYQGKLMLGGNPLNPSSLYFSLTLNATTVSNIYVFSGYGSGSKVIDDGEAIVGFASNNTEFFIIKRNGFHKITGTYDDGISYSYTTNKETSSGVINPFCVVNVNKEIIYFDGITIRRLSYEQNVQALSDSAIGEPIEKIFENLSQKQDGNAFMVYAYPYVKLFLRSNISSENDYCVIYNTVDKAFSIQTNIEGAIGDYGTYNNKNVAFIGGRFEPIIYKDNEGTSFNDDDIAGYAKSKKLTFGDSVNYKLVKEAEFNGNITIGLSANFSIYGDNKLITTKTITGESNGTSPSTMGSSVWGATLIGASGDSESNVASFELKIPLYNTFKELEYVVEINGQGTFELTGATFSQRLKKEYGTH